MGRRVFPSTTERIGEENGTFWQDFSEEIPRPGENGEVGKFDRLLDFLQDMEGRALWIWPSESSYRHPRKEYKQAPSRGHRNGKEQDKDKAQDQTEPLSDMEPILV